MPLSDNEIIEDLTQGGTASLEKWVLISGDPCIADKGKVYEMCWEDLEIDGRIVEGQYYEVVVGFLRRIGARQYRSKEQYEQDWMLFGNCPDWGER